MTRRQQKALTWLQDHPGWHTVQEIAVGCAPRAKDRKKVAPAFAGPLKKLHAMGLVELQSSPGGRRSYRVMND